ncbi:OmpA family protein [Janthinobacterium sp. NKUCC08_JDC]|uniref:OmpA family protein n=1 Tax=Janthinobacterium sp. NKUCC08_JDC TaxID=2842122 RepID=UPI001C5A89EC|nr:OmpA family protein [Janthinobacterium sp. NKUCC08_JDC]MBW3500253.1 OmpA family protein [Janthinobacterium sp. NKUCC08_JDC]
MSPYLEVIIPAALALYAGFQHEGRCGIEPAVHPLAENMCQGLRAAFEDGCKTLLEVPLGKTGIYLAGSYSIKPVAFAPLVREKVQEGYSACVGFWSGSIDYDTYQTALEQKASVLNAMFKAVGKPGSAAPVLDAAVANGARRDDVMDAKVAAGDLRQDCMGPATIKCGHITTPPTDPVFIPPDPQTVNRLSAAVADLAQEIKRQNERGPRVVAGGTGKWTLAAEISFATGSSTPRQEDCARLAANVTKASPNAQRVQIAGAADERGTPAANNALSLQRAASAALCLATHAPAKRWSIEITGAGSLATSPAEYARARRATVFVWEPQP